MMTREEALAQAQHWLKVIAAMLRGNEYKSRELSLENVEILLEKLNRDGDLGCVLLAALEAKKPLAEAKGWLSEDVLGLKFFSYTASNPPAKRLETRHAIAVYGTFQAVAILPAEEEAAP